MADGHNTSRPPAHNPERFSGETGRKILSESVADVIGRVCERIALADEQFADMMPVRVADAKALILALEAAELRAIEAIDERDTIAARHLELSRRANTQRTSECARCGGSVAGGGCLECGEVS